MNRLAHVAQRSLFAALLLGSALLPGTGLRAQNCQPTIKQTTTFNRGWLCSTITYCYEVCNPAGCVLPIQKFCVDFPCGVDQLDAGSISSPPGWGGTVDAVTNQVCWNAVVRANQIQPGQCKQGFCITTICNPRCIEGIQNATFWSERGVLIQNNVRTLFAFAGDHRNFLAGESSAQLGSTYLLRVTNAADPFSQDFVLASPFPLTTGVNIQGFGLLLMDPVLILPLGPAPIGPDGRGMLPLPIPPQPTLSGATLVMQALTLTPSEPRLSNDKVVTLR